MQVMDFYGENPAQFGYKTTTTTTKWHRRSTTKDIKKNFHVIMVTVCSIALWPSTYFPSPTPMLLFVYFSSMKSPLNVTVKQQNCAAGHCYKGDKSAHGRDAATTATLLHRLSLRSSDCFHVRILGSQCG